MSRTRIAVLALALATLLTGCGAAVDKVTEKAADKAVEKALESSTDGDVDLERNGDGVAIKTDDGSMTVDSEGNMTIESDEGTMTIESGGELPDDFPDIPLPEGMTIEATSHIAGDGTDVYTVSGGIDGDGKDVFSAVVSDLETKGFSTDFRNDSTTDGEFYGSSMSTNADGLQVLTTVITDGEVTQVAFTVSTAQG